MMERKEIIKNALIIFCVIILLGFLGGFVSGILDLGEAAGIFVRTAGLILLIFLGMKLYSQYYTKPLTQEMKEEESKEADQKEKKQLLFKPTIGASILFIFLISLCVFPIIAQLISHSVNFGLTIGLIGVMVFFIWVWYKTPVFIFTEDSVQIKSHLFYLFGIDRKTVIIYADITSVCPDAKMNGMYGVDSRHQIVISTNGTTQKYSLDCYKSDIVAKIWLRLREKLGDKVKLH